MFNGKRFTGHGIIFIEVSMPDTSWSDETRAGFAGHFDQEKIYIDQIDADVVALGG